MPGADQEEFNTEQPGTQRPDFSDKTLQEKFKQQVRDIQDRLDDVVAVDPEQFKYTVDPATEPHLFEEPEYNPHEEDAPNVIDKIDKPTTLIKKGGLVHKADKLPNAVVSTPSSDVQVSPVGYVIVGDNSGKMFKVKVADINLITKNNFRHSSDLKEVFKKLTPPYRFVSKERA